MSVPQEQSRQCRMLDDLLIWCNVRLNDRPVRQMQLWDLTNAGGSSFGGGMRRSGLCLGRLTRIIGAVLRARISGRIRKIDCHFAQRVPIGRGSHVDARSEDESIKYEACHEDMRHCRERICVRIPLCRWITRKNGNRQGSPHNGIEFLSYRTCSYFTFTTSI